MHLQVVPCYLRTWGGAGCPTLIPGDVWTACKVTANGSQTGLLTAADISFGLHHFKRDAQRKRCGQVVVLLFFLNTP